MATTPVYVDLVNGNDANNGSSFAQRMKTIAAATANSKMSNGGTCRLMGTAYPTDLGVTGAWTEGSGTVTLSAALTSLLYDCTTAWTALSANVTTDTNVAAQKGGSAARSVLVATAFTTGQACYKDTGTINASGFDSLTFWIKTSTAVAASSIRIETYTNTGGTGVDKTFDVGFATVANRWHPVTIQNAAMSSAVKGIGMNILIDVGTNCTVTLQNINACNYNSIHLQTQIGKNSAGETYAPISYISGTTVKLDQGVNTVVVPLYAGATETVEAYTRFPPNVANQTQGNATTPTISGGWNTTDMSTQDGETWVSGSLTTGGGFLLTLSVAGATCDKVSTVLANGGFTLTGTTITLSNSHNNGHSSFAINTARCSALVSVWSCYNAVANSYSGVTTNTISTTITDLVMNSNAAAVLISAATSGIVITRFTAKRNTTVASLIENLFNSKITTATIANNGTSPDFTGTGNEIRGWNSTGNTGYGLQLSQAASNTWIGFTTSGNTVGSITGNSSQNANNIFIEPSISEATIYTAGIGGQAPGARMQSLNADGTKFRSYFASGTIVSDTTTRHTASEVSRKFSPTSANATSDLSIWEVLGAPAVSSGTAVTVTCWVYRDNTGITAQLRLIGGTIGGVAADVTAVAVGSAGVWEQLTLTFTPSEQNGVEIRGEAWGGTTFNAYFQDFAVSQV